MALTAAFIPFESVQSGTWQKGLSIPPRKKHTKVRMVTITKGKNMGKQRQEKFGGETDSQWKNRLKAHAQRLYPDMAITLDTADALLIATYCQRKREGKL